eukprot:SAG22_NODE_332_length_12161_cov_7.722066_5_plen_206_part_00
MRGLRVITWTLRVSWHSFSLGLHASCMHDARIGRAAEEVTYTYLYLFWPGPPPRPGSDDSVSDSDDHWHGARSQPFYATDAGRRQRKACPARLRPGAGVPDGPGRHRHSGLPRGRTSRVGLARGQRAPAGLSGCRGLGRAAAQRRGVTEHCMVSTAPPPAPASSSQQPGSQQRQPADHSSRSLPSLPRAAIVARAEFMRPSVAGR